MTTTLEDAVRDIFTDTTFMKQRPDGVTVYDMHAEVVGRGYHPPCGWLDIWDAMSNVCRELQEGSR